jgi:uncharacterized heparinase superfamily protein
MLGRLRRLPLLFHTLRRLRWEQVAYRPLRRVQARLPVRLRVDVAPPSTEARAALASAVAGWGADDAAATERRAREVLRGEFRFLNHAETLPEIDWSRRHVSHLWSYNLHYFDYAVDLARAWRATGDAAFRDRFSALALGWIAVNPAGRGDGWEPYAVSLRIVNWVYALLLFGDGLDGEVRRRIEGGVAEQAEFLSRRLERHILGNHLQKNLKALVVAGVFFSGSSAARWLRAGERMLWHELFEQVLPDGAHYERSPMYHAIALADFLEVLSLLGPALRPVGEDVRRRVRAMADAFGVLSRPDGTLHLFNDAAEGIAPGRAWLDGLARSVFGAGIPSPDGVVVLPDAGYYGVVDAARGGRLLVDCGEPGPDYQPGHAHCDLLSFELDVDGAPFAVDAGVSGYDGDPFREYVRSTRAHNTVMVGGREQSEMWDTFRMARRARVLGARIEAAAGEVVFSGAYTPYWSRAVVHAREIRGGAGLWRVTDRVSGADGAPLQSFLHLHPRWEATVEDGRVVAKDGARTVVVEPFGVDRVVVLRGERAPVQGWHCPEFGRALPAPAVEMQRDRHDGGPFGYMIQWCDA